MYPLFVFFASTNSALLRGSQFHRRCDMCSIMRIAWKRGSQQLTHELLFGRFASLRMLLHWICVFHKLMYSHSLSLTLSLSHSHSLTLSLSHTYTFTFPLTNVLLYDRVPHFDNDNGSDPYFLIYTPPTEKEYYGQDFALKEIFDSRVRFLFSPLFLSADSWDCSNP